MKSVPLLPVGVSLNPGKKIDQPTYNFEREMMLPRNELKTDGGVLSLYFAFTPSSRAEPRYGVCDVVINSIDSYEDLGQGADQAQTIWGVNYLWNPHQIIIPDPDRKGFAAKFVSDLISQDGFLKDPAGIGDEYSGFFGNRREYQDNGPIDFGYSIDLDKVLISA